MTTTRPTAVAGSFYPGAADELYDAIRTYLAAASSQASSAAGRRPKAVIAPHAGYMYSGPVAGSAYAALRPLRGTIERVVLLGPSHRVAFSGLALSSAENFATPLGEIPIDDSARRQILALAQVRELDEAHVEEHSLEVHLPFLQEVLGRFRLVPLLVGDAKPEEVAEVLDLIWGGDETLIVISSDLSHYQDYATAQRLDRATADSIEALDRVASHDACGCKCINGFIELARRRELRAVTVDLRNSGDTAGPRDRVVGYGAFIFEPKGR